MITRAEALSMIAKGLAMAMAGQEALAAALTPPGVRVAALPDLIAAVKSAQAGDVVTLAPGQYGALALDRIIAPGVVVAGEGATLSALKVTKSTGLTVRGLAVSGAPGAYCGQISNCSEVAFENGEFFGGRVGVVVQKSEGVAIRGSRFHGLSSDGVNVSGTSNIVIEGNDFTDFFPAPSAHPDAIQFMTVGTTTSAENIIVRRNRMHRGAGALFQGVFIAPQADGLPYRHVTIEDNLIVGCMANGIGVYLAEDVVIQRNTVQPIEGLLSRIHLADINGGRVADNRYVKLTQAGTNIGLDIRDKATLQAISAAQAAKL